MTYKQTLALLCIGQSHTFDTLAQAETARAAACKFYNGMRFTRAGLTLTRIA